MSFFGPSHLLLYVFVICCVFMSFLVPLVSYCHFSELLVAVFASFGKMKRSQASGRNMRHNQEA